MADPPDGDGRRRLFGGDGRSLRDILDQPLIMVLLAGALGMGGTLQIVSQNPDVRADPFTGAEGSALEARIKSLEVQQALDNQHRTDAVRGYDRIRALETRCQSNANRIENLRRDITRLERRLGRKEYDR